MITLANVRSDPYAFIGPYAGCYDVPEVAMDRRHVFALREVLSAWPFRNALELGSFNGASSTAFIEAINAGSLRQATFCDTRPTESLWTVCRNCHRIGRVTITDRPSWQSLDSKEDYDFILVDACHDIASVTKELQRLIARRPLCVMAHDTNATAWGYPHAEGAELLKNTFANMQGYHCIEDGVHRDGERTERGLFLATWDAELYALASRVFERWN
jgi:hypothetical protein